jgi:glutathione peroxidase
MASSAFYKLSAILNNGSTKSMGDFVGKVVYATNVASKWGLTSREYARFEKLGNQYGDQLVILGFPSREFGGQEFKTDEEIKAFADSKNYPGYLMKPSQVTGPGASEVWKYFLEATGASEPTWNFSSKFLVSKTGEVIVPGKDLEADIAKLMEA